MSATRYSGNYGEYRDYIMMFGGDNTTERTRLLQNLSRAINDELTERQRRMINMHFIEGLSMTEIAGVLGVNVSTVSRTIKRGKARLQRCLRYGARALIEENENYDRP